MMQLQKKLFANVPYKIIGKTANDNSLLVTYGKKVLANEKIAALKTAWQIPMEEYFS